MKTKFQACEKSSVIEFSDLKKSFLWAELHVRTFQPVVGFIVWAFRKLKNPRSREVSFIAYAPIFLHHCNFLFLYKWKSPALDASAMRYVHSSSPQTRSLHGPAHQTTLLILHGEWLDSLGCRKSANICKPLRYATHSSPLQRSSRHGMRPKGVWWNWFRAKPSG